MTMQTRSCSNVARSACASPVAGSIQTPRFGFLLLLLLMLGLLSVSRAQASGIVGTGTPSSCTEAALDAALAGGGTVTFNCGGSATITVTTMKTISSNTTVDGGSLVTLSGGLGVRVFTVSQGTRLNLQNLTVANTQGDYGSSCGVLLNRGGTVNIDHSSFLNNGSSNRGGAICNGDIFDPLVHGVMTISNSAFSGNGTGGKGGVGGAIHNQGGELIIADSIFLNNSAGSGGAIYTYGGTVSIGNCTFSGNMAGSMFMTARGGAIEIDSGMAVIANSTFSGNTAPEGGGPLLSGSTVAITNTTFYSNSATTQGGAIFGSVGTIVVTHSTFAGNNATAQGGSINNFGATIILYSTIVADSMSGGNCTGSIANGGNNLDSGTTCGFATTNGSKSNTNPLLGPLANNGGPTQTMALLPGSPAIDAVGDAAHCAATDQRGVFRPQGAACDIGAFESIVPSLFLPLLRGN